LLGIDVFGKGLFELGLVALGRVLVWMLRTLPREVRIVSFCRLSLKWGHA
jgi:hypothetical protein